MDSEMPYFLVWHQAPGASCSIIILYYPSLVSCPFYAIPIIPFLIYQTFHLLVYT